VKLTFDPAKNERNIRERGLSFTRAAEFDFATALAIPTFRNGEHRMERIGYLDDRLHVLCSKVTEEGLRIISFRKANSREAKRYGFELRR
jgi:uncharacterized DUF497 family protein